MSVATATRTSVMSALHILQVDTIIPGCTEPPQLSELQTKYYEARIQLSSLIHVAFIEAFVKRGLFILYLHLLFINIL